MMDLVKPDVLVIQNDGWFIPYYIKQLRAKEPSGEYRWPEHAAVPIVASLAVDGKNFRGEWIKDVTLAVFWTEFALNEARIGGYAGKSAIIPLGVDLDTFYPVERQGAMERQKLTGLKGKFIVGNVNRNQPRKRPDLSVKYFAEWIHSHKVDNAWLFFHTAPTEDNGCNILQLAQHYDVVNRLALAQPEMFYGVTDADLRDRYNCFDAQITTTQGEGFGLTTFEGMACGVPQIVPDAAALGELISGAGMLVPCTSTALQNPTLTVIGGVPDEKAFIQALDTIYRDPHRCQIVKELGRKRVEQQRFRWQHIGEAWVKLLDDLLTKPEPPSDEVWQELKPAEVKKPQEVSQ
jgi:glycosyltransferase involved in cell wall biosynthesis